MTSQPPQRVSPPVFPERWDRPGKPADDALPTIQDAFRQTGFQLGGDLRLLHEGMNLQLQVVQASSASKYRTHALAAGLLLWSRAFLAVSDAAAAVTRASYGSVPPLARMACECLAAAHQAHTDELPAFSAWLADALAPDEAVKAIDIGIGQFMAGSTIAAEADLGAVFRAASEFARPHFGVALTLGAPESNRTRVAVTFADQTFHFGYAQLTLGWLLTLCDVALRLARVASAPYHVPEDTAAAIDRWSAAVAALLAQPDRCRVEQVGAGMDRRWLLHNVRRQSGGAPRRLLL
jgi:hypothetical protein